MKALSVWFLDIMIVAAVYLPGSHADSALGMWVQVQYNLAY